MTTLTQPWLATMSVGHDPGPQLKRAPEGARSRGRPPFGRGRGAAGARLPTWFGRRSTSRVGNCVYSRRRKATRYDRWANLPQICWRHDLATLSSAAVFATDRGGPYKDLGRAWERIAKRAGFEGITLHTLRHSFATTANMLGCSEPTIAAMLGHSRGTVTRRYVHHVDEALRAAADRVAGAIARAMAGEKPADILDDWGLQPFGPDQRRDLLEIVEERYPSDFSVEGPASDSLSMLAQADYYNSAGERRGPWVVVVLLM